MIYNEVLFERKYVSFYLVNNNESYINFISPEVKALC